MFVLPPPNIRNAVHLAARCAHVGVLHALLDGLDPQMRLALVNEPDKLGITPVFLTNQRVCADQEI
jgi:hypothetical protein